MLSFIDDVEASRHYDHGTFDVWQGCSLALGFTCLFEGLAVSSLAGYDSQQLIFSHFLKWLYLFISCKSWGDVGDRDHLSGLFQHNEKSCEFCSSGYSLLFFFFSFLFCSFISILLCMEVSWILHEICLIPKYTCDIDDLGWVI